MNHQGLFVFSGEAKLEEFESCSRYDQRRLRIRMNFPEEDNPSGEFPKFPKDGDHEFRSGNRCDTSKAFTSRDIQSF
jgi:hypothetical protein